MTSELKRLVNRANSQASTGPKTLAGRKRSAQNARRHGLSASTSMDPAWAPALHALETRFKAEKIDTALGVDAFDVAGACIDVERVRMAKRDLVARYRGTPDAELADLARELILLDRYHRRALSRRKHLIQRLSMTHREDAE